MEQPANVPDPLAYVAQASPSDDAWTRWLQSPMSHLRRVSDPLLTDMVFTPPFLQQPRTIDERASAASGHYGAGAGYPAQPPGFFSSPPMQNGALSNVNMHQGANGSANVKMEPPMKPASPAVDKLKDVAYRLQSFASETRSPSVNDFVPYGFQSGAPQMANQSNTLPPVVERRNSIDSQGSAGSLGKRKVDNVYRDKAASLTDEENTDNDDRESLEGLPLTYNPNRNDGVFEEAPMYDLSTDQVTNEMGQVFVSPMTGTVRYLPENYAAHGSYVGGPGVSRSSSFDASRYHSAQARTPSSRAMGARSSGDYSAYAPPGSAGLPRGELQTTRSDEDMHHGAHAQYAGQHQRPGSGGYSNGSMPPPTFHQGGHGVVAAFRHPQNRGAPLIPGRTPVAGGQHHQNAASHPPDQVTYVSTTPLISRPRKIRRDGASEEDDPSQLTLQLLRQYMGSRGHVNSPSSAKPEDTYMEGQTPLSMTRTLGTTPVLTGRTLRGTPILSSRSVSVSQLPSTPIATHRPQLASGPKPPGSAQPLLASPQSLQTQQLLQQQHYPRPSQHQHPLPPPQHGRVPSHSGPQPMMSPQQHDAHLVNGFAASPDFRMHGLPTPLSSNRSLPGTMADRMRDPQLAAVFAATDLNIRGGDTSLEELGKIVEDEEDDGAGDKKKHRRFVCEFCDKSFPGRVGLIRHLRVHTGEAPFKCPDCGKCFKQKGTLTSHYRIHTGEMPFPCSLCGTPFRHRGNLSRHEKTCRRNLEKRADGSAVGVSDGDEPDPYAANGGGMPSLHQLNQLDPALGVPPSDHAHYQ